MNAATDTTDIATPAAAPSHTRPFYWSVQRELWEARSLYIAPLVAAGVVLLGLIISALHLPGEMPQPDPDRLRGAVAGVGAVLSMLVVLTTAIATWFYALDALHGERRDRSILFWKSMPVSDLTVVLTKLFTALIVAPAIAFVIIVAGQLLIMVLGSVVVLLHGVSAAPIWTSAKMFQITGAVLYGLVAAALWYAPIYAWLLLVSAWAKRSTFLWAILPPVAVIMFERVAFGTSYFGDMIRYRLGYGLQAAFGNSMPRGGMAAEGAGVEASVRFPDQMLQALNPVQFLSNPWLWVGLAAAAAFVAAAVWMRRYREPL
jgi:ABC-2 type transport system permease protein